MGLELITGPASEPVSLDEAKAHMRVDNDDEDSLIVRLIKSARETAERYTGRALLAQSFALARDRWPTNNPRSFEIPRPPLVAVTTVVVRARSGTETTLSSDAYIVDSASVPGRVVFKDTTVLPPDLADANAILVSFDAGYGSLPSDVPAAIRSAILILVAYHYEQRGNAPAQPPADALALLAPFRVVAL